MPDVGRELQKEEQRIQFMEMNLELFDPVDKASQSAGPPYS